LYTFFLPAGALLLVGIDFTGALDVLDVLGLEAHSDEASDELRDTGNAGEDAQGQGWCDGGGAAEDAREYPMGEDLHALGVADGVLTVVLDGVQIVFGEGARA
jgi:hypothetical protein